MSGPAKTGKAKKKTKPATMALEEFNQMQAPHGHAIVSVKGLDWAATMEAYDTTKEDKKIVLPQAPRSQREPGVDPESLPKDPPYKVVLNNLPFGATEQDIQERFFKTIGVKNVVVDRGDAQVELETFQDLYEALGKHGATFKNKEVCVSLYGQNMAGRGGGYGDRYGAGRQGGERSGFRDRNATGGLGFSGSPGAGLDEPDRTDSDWRSAPRPTPPAARQPMYNNDRMGTGQRPQYGSRRSYDPENRNKYEGRSSYPERPGGLESLNNRDSYSDRGDDRFLRSRMMNERQPERDFANVRLEARPPPIVSDRDNIIKNYPVSRMERDSYSTGSDRTRQAPHAPTDHTSPHYAPMESVQSQASNALGIIDEPRSITPQSSSQNRPLLDGPNSEPTITRRSEAQRKPIILKPRTKPIEPVSEAPTRNPAIFGEAKPVDTTVREREIEEKLRGMSLEQQQQQQQQNQQQPQPDQPDKPASAPRSRRVSEAFSETSSNTVAKE